MTENSPQRTPDVRGEPVYPVVWPLGRVSQETTSLAPRVKDLRGKTVCELSDFLFRAEKIFPLLRKLLMERYPGIRFVEYSTFGDIHGPTEEETMTRLPERLREHGCDVVIAGVGG